MIFLVLMAFILIIFQLWIQNSKSSRRRTEDDNTVIVYNRIPKTGSTSFMHLPYELCGKNDFNVLLLNISGPHFMTLSDQVFFAKNITGWKEKHPAIYHGHFAYVNLHQVGSLDSERPDANVLYINLIRQPLDRLVSYYYFLRYGDDYRVNKIRSRMGDTVTFDECVTNKMPDCDVKKLWLQVPWFCGHFRRCWEPAGNKWALEQAKHNLANKYFLVGLTDELESFVDILESTLPRFFRGAGEMYRSDTKWSHIRRTKHKDPLKAETIQAIRATKVWKMEQEFYEFAQVHFMALKAEFEETRAKRLLHYDKIRPRAT